MLNLGGAKTVLAGAFEGSETERVTVSANATINAMCGLDSSFINFYNDNGKKAGTYVKNNRIWTMQ